MKEIWENKIKVNPDNMFHLKSAKDLKPVLRRVRNENIVSIGGGTHWKYYLITEGICDIIVFNANIPTPPQAFPVYKGFPYMEMFNKK